jgi:integrase/recombinase XerD
MEKFEKYLTEQGKTSATINRYVYDMKRIKLLVERGSTELDEMGYHDVLAFIDKRKKKDPSVFTINKELLVMRHYFEFLIEEKVRQDNPAFGLKLKGEYKFRLTNLFKAEELEEMYATHSDATPVKLRNKILLGFMIYQGLKTQEIAKIKLSDIDFDNCTIYVSETMKSNGRKLQLKSKQILPLVQYLEKRIEINPIIAQKTDKLIISSQGEEYTGMNHLLKKLVMAMKKKYDRFENWNQIRTSVIVSQLNVDNTRQMQEYFGMKKIKTIEKYLQNTVEDLREELDRMFV